ncbi:gamma-glutamyl-gamma-aminobutyrate hydrolase family protein [Tropicimonas sp. S265A]|uniref:gamma-glutamyl-gamma-aminobutyrate hydrolase family protein n=1 Tax=Tropicimonas sp. S265A TaxID=3415134 RepID=UPI003C7E935A
MSRRPKIGVTVSRRSGWRIFPLMALNVWLAGGRAVKWQTATDVNIDAVDGIIIGGGDDIGPRLYGGDISLSVRLDHVRDAMEKWILEKAFESDLPILGICRGAQMLNVVLGGTLHQDAYTRYGSRRFHTILPKREVDVTPGTRLSQIIGEEPMCVNALHKQSVAKLGRNLRVSATDEKGMVQAIERTSDPFAVGVQWHPEHIFYEPRHRALFAALVVAARAARDSREQIGAVDLEIEKRGPILGT